MATAVIMPKLEMSQETATVVEWLKGEGELVRKGEPLLTVETDKVTVEVESPAAGVLAGIRAESDQVVPVTQVIAYVLQPGEKLPHEPGLDSAGIGAPKSAPAPVATPVAQRMAAAHSLDLSAIAGSGPAGRIAKADVEAALAALASPTQEVLPDKVRATPAARRVAREREVDLAVIPGRGPRGRVQAADVLAYQPIAATAFQEDYEVVPLRGMRRAIAARMQQSYQTAPHIQLTAEVDVSAVQALRAEFNQRAEVLGEPRLSVTAILVKVCAWALQRHHWANAALHGEEIRLYRTANIGVAVALEEGLIVPVIRGAERLGLASIARQIQDLSERARKGRLDPKDVNGGTFTISNLGMYGIDQFSAILNPPESAILAVGRIAKRTVVVERDGRDEMVIRPMMTVTLSADHRVLDGAIAARFLRDIVDALEQPNLLLW